MTGHETLVSHLKNLLQMAEQFQFHEYRNTRFATPKMELARRLQQLRQNTMNGLYDNLPNDERHDERVEKETP